MEITEKVAYLKGLAEGMELNTDKKEGKLLSAIIDVLEDIALELCDIEEAQEELGDGLDAVSDDLEDVEDLLFGEDEDEEDLLDEDDLLEDEEGEELLSYYFGTYVCPECGEEMPVLAGMEEYYLAE